MESVLPWGNNAQIIIYSILERSYDFCTGGNMRGRTWQNVDESQKWAEQKKLEAKGDNLDSLFIRSS